MNSRMHQMGAALDYTAGENITAGKLIKVAGLVGMAINDIASGAVGALQVKGVAAVRKKDEAIVAGLPIWWDANGSPKVGTASTGAATAVGASAMAAADLLLGHAVYDAAAADEWVYVKLNEFSPEFPAWPNRLWSVGATATYSTDQLGNVIEVVAKDQVITLREIATVYIGNELIIVNNCADPTAGTGLRITPHANDGFNGFGITHATNKHLTNTAGTAKRGDYIRLLAAGDTHWQVLELKGIWARQS